jgi:hypothetical protein
VKSAYSTTSILVFVTALIPLARLRLLLFNFLRLRALQQFETLIFSSLSTSVIVAQLGDTLHRAGITFFPVLLHYVSSACS